MKNWMRKFEDVMAAAAYAEAGEFETAKETLKEERRVLLALSGATTDMNAFSYAINACKRIGAELEIMYDSGAKASLKQLRPELRKLGIDCSYVKQTGRLEEEIQNYTRNKSNILFVVLEVSEDFDMQSKKAGTDITDAWKNLKCPLVVVSKNVMPSMI